MTRDEIIRMAREAGFETKVLNSIDGEEVICFDPLITDMLKDFAALVAAHDREERTKELMQLFLDPENQPTQFGTATLEHREQEVLAEREACAKVCETYTDNDLGAYSDSEGHGYSCAAAIRARGEE